VDCVLTAIALQSSWRGNLALQGSRLKLIMVIWWIAPNYRLGHDSHKCAQLKIGENEKSLSLFSSLFPFTQMLLQSLFIYLCLTFFFLLFIFSWVELFCCLVFSHSFLPDILSFMFFFLLHGVYLELDWRHYLGCHFIVNMLCFKVMTNLFCVLTYAPVSVLYYYYFKKLPYASIQSCCAQ